MKQLYINVFLLTILFFGGCSKQSASLQSVDGLVSFNISGIEDVSDEFVKSGSSEVGAANEIYSKLVVDGNNEYIVSIYEDRHGNSTKVTGSKNKVGATTFMDPNVRYRVLLYEANGDYVTTLEGNSSTPLSYNQIRQGKEYKWIAYSYNKTDAIPALGNNNSPTIVSTAQGGLLYASDTFTAPGAPSGTIAQQRVDIVFKRKTSSIEVIVNGRALFDRITNVALSTNLTGLKSEGVFNLKDGIYESYTSATAVTNYTNASFTQFRASSGDTIRKLEINTVDGINSLASFNLTFSGITQPTDLNFSPVSRSREFTNSSTITVPGFTPQLGKRYRIVYTPLYRAFTLPNGTGTVKWAMGNLYFDDARQAYAFLHFNSNYYFDSSFLTLPPPSTLVPRQNLYWKWRALIPGAAGTANVGDPCSKVYPLGLWKSPSMTDFNSIHNVTATTTGSTFPRMYTQRSDDPLRYMEVRTNVSANQPIDPYNWQEAMVLMQLGHYNSSGELVHYRTGNSGRSGVYYWSSSSAAGIGNPYSITNLAPNTSTMSKNTSSSFSANSNSTGAEVLNVPVTNDFRLNVRCIRDGSFTTYVPKLPN